MCQREGERGGQVSVCVCVCVRARVCVCVHAHVYTGMCVSLDLAIAEEITL
jgi:hypothetical protein